MQSVRAILQISNRGVQLTDEFGAANRVELELMLGTAVRLEFDLRGGSGPDSGELAAYPVESFSGSTNYFALDSRNRNSNSPALLKYSGITLATDEAGHHILSVELENNATEKIIEIVAGEEKAVFRAEIGGVDADGVTLFAWQFDITIRSRVFIGQADEVIANDPAYYTAAQMLALLREQSDVICSNKADTGLANIDADGKQMIVDQMAYVPSGKLGGTNTQVFAFNTVYEAAFDGIAYMTVKSKSTAMCSVVLGSFTDTNFSNYMYEKNSTSGVAGVTVSAILFVPKGFWYRFYAEGHDTEAEYNLWFIPLKGAER